MRCVGKRLNRREFPGSFQKDRRKLRLTALNRPDADSDDPRAVIVELSQFAVWNFLAGTVYVLSVGPVAYGAGSVASGQASFLDGVGSLIAGVAIGAGAVLLGMRYHRRRKAQTAAHASPGSAAAGMRNGRARRE